MNNVTLIVFEGVLDRWDSTRRVFDHCRSLFDFAAAHYVTKDFNKHEAMAFEIGGVLPFVQTSHALICTWDGFISNPHLWRDSWLQYDYIGAPWPASWDVGHRVGNAGFTLQSRRFLEQMRAHSSEYDPAKEPTDVWMCRTNHQRFCQTGLRYAPVEEAAAFSFEHPTEEGIAGKDTSFGFHGWVSGKTQSDYYARL